MVVYTGWINPEELILVIFNPIGIGRLHNSVGRILYAIRSDHSSGGNMATFEERKAELAAKMEQLLEGFGDIALEQEALQAEQAAAAAKKAKGRKYLSDLLGIPQANAQQANTQQTSAPQANTQQANTRQANTQQANTQQANTRQANTQQANTQPRTAANGKRILFSIGGRDFTA
jgi:hypothetical protein